MLLFNESIQKPNFQQTKKKRDSSTNGLSRENIRSKRCKTRQARPNETSRSFAEVGKVFVGGRLGENFGDLMVFKIDEDDHGSRASGLAYGPENLTSGSSATRQMRCVEKRRMDVREMKLTVTSWVDMAGWASIICPFALSKMIRSASVTEAREVYIIRED